jgi:hypothetical protein
MLHVAASVSSEVSTMRHASYNAAGTVFPEAALRSQKTRRRSIFASILAALRHSRRRLSFQLPVLGETALITIIAIAF